jgi:hypothetical protein
LFLYLDKTTAMKSKARSIQDQLGFTDEELSTPKHDEILIWLDENIETIAVELFPSSWTEKETGMIARAIKQARAVWVERCSTGTGLNPEAAREVRILRADIQHFRNLGDVDKESRVRGNLERLLESLGASCPIPGPPSPQTPFSVHEKLMEVPLKDGHYLRGVVDYCVTGSRPFFRLEGIEAVHFNPVWTRYDKPYKLLFEIKPTIRSLGELMRQVNVYRSCEPESHFLVVSPDDRFRKQIESQGVRFVKYE